MGHSRSFHYACAFAASFLVSGCKQQIQRDEVEQIAERHSDVALTEALNEIARLERKLEAIEPRIVYLESIEKINSKAIDGVSAQVSNNAKVANDNALKDMTAAGACGKDRVDFPDGSWTVRNRQCTLKDMRR